MAVINFLVKKNKGRPYRYCIAFLVYYVTQWSYYIIEEITISVVVKSYQSAHART